MPFETGERVAPSISPMACGTVVRVIARDAKGETYAIRWEHGSLGHMHESDLVAAPEPRRAG